MLKLIILGALQGLTEFFPVSSSGHLVVAQHFLDIRGNVVFLDVFLHIGTILALGTFFFKDILRALKTPKLLLYIAVVTLITGAVGLAFRRPLEALFTSARGTAWPLLVNGAVLLAVPLFKERQRSPGMPDSVVMGVAQAAAIIPGISRSGATIVSLLARGVKKEEAFRFSFLASIPAVVGAFLLEAGEAGPDPGFGTAALVAGLTASYVFGILALWALKKIIDRQKLHYFGYYCVVLGLALLFYFKI